jgi:hypothetical protein
MIDQAFREQDHVARRATNVHESNEEEDSAARRGEARRGEARRSELASTAPVL